MPTARASKNDITNDLNALIKKGASFRNRRAAFVAKQAAALKAFDEALKQEKGSIDTEGKKLLARFIKNKRIALVDRWNAFAQAPAEFKNHSQYIVHLGPEFDSFVEYHVADQGKGTVVDMTEHGNDFIFNYVEDGKDSCLEWDATNTLTNAALLEAILAKNLGFFCYDW